MPNHRLALNGRLASVEPFASSTAALHLPTQAREDAARCEHKKVGINYHLLNICAAIGLGQLRVLDDRVARSRAINACYRENLPGIAFMREAPYGRATNWLTVIQLDSKTTRATPEDLRLALERANIESRAVWKPMHLQPVFKGARCIGGAVAEQLFANGLCLPSGSAMTDADVDRVSDVISRNVYGR